MDFSKYLIQDRRPGDYVTWEFRFPNGHTASVITDPRAGNRFRFEVHSTDPDDQGRGNVVAGLTTDQVEAKLEKVAGLPQNRTAA